MSWILKANDLPTGHVVFWTGSRWAADVAAAERFATSEDAKTPLAAGAGTAVVEPYPVELDAAGRLPIIQRERINALGPTVRPDLARSAPSAGA